VPKLSAGDESVSAPRSVIHGGRVALPGGLVDADVAIEGSHIVAVGRDLSGDADLRVDARGLWVLPGLVDVHTHLEIEADGLITADDFTSGTIAAVAGGTTSIIDFAVQQADLPLEAALDRWLDKLVQHPPVVDVGFHIMIREVHSDGAEQELIALAARGVTSFKIFMAYRGWMVDEETIFRTARAAAACGAVLLVHAESGGIIEALISDAVERGETAMAWHARTRPPATEAAAVAQVIRICEMVGCPVYIMHVSSTLALEEILKAKARGAQVWGETCPQYLTFTEDVLHRAPEEAAKYVFTPPPRTSDDRSRLWSALERGVLSVVSTDHTPYKLSEKVGRRFDQVPQGAPGIGERLAVMFDGVTKARITLETMVDVCARTPALLFGMWPRKGEIRVGSDADMILFDPMGETIVSAAGSHSKVDHSLYEQMRFPGAVRSVFVRGRKVVDDGVVTPAPAAGRFLQRNAWLSRDGHGTAGEGGPSGQISTP
jgi:dihydropyrimidinase